MKQDHVAVAVQAITVEVSRLDVGPGDIVVLRWIGPYWSSRTAHDANAALAEKFPDVRFLVVDGSTLSAPVVVAAGTRIDNVVTVG